jgi:SAM-dependent methyltransferase
MERGITVTTPHELWDSAVHEYLSADDADAIDVIFPALTRAIGDLAGKVVLDYGCGSGRHARILAALGAGQVIGVDMSANMIAAATAADPDSRVQYHHLPENRLAPLADASVDVVAANMVFMMSPSKADLIQSFAEIHRVLRPGGIFVYCITHPAFIDKEAHDGRRVFDSDGFQYLREGYRYRFTMKNRQGEDIDGGFYDYHYTLTTYLQSTIDAGFLLRSFDELRYSEEIVKKYAIAEEFLRYPQSIIMAWSKAG